MLCNSFSWNTQRFNLKNWWAFKLLGGIFMPTAGLLLVWKQRTEEVQGDRWSYRKNGTTATSCCFWYKKIGEGRNERGGEKRHCNSLSPNQADERWQPQSLGARITILSLCLSSSHTHTHTPRCWSLCRGVGCQAMFTHTLQKHCHLCSSVFHSWKG